MRHTIIYDCEFMTAEGAQSRFWCGPHDPDPVVVQIGLVKLGLAGGFPLIETKRLYVIPRDRHGNRTGLDPFFTRLTGISEDQIDRHGISLQSALDQTSAFAAGAPLWSWGKDEHNMLAISCFVAGFPPPIPATQFGNACALLLKAGMPYDDIKVTRSNQLADYFKLEHPALRAHDALDDALSIAYVLRHLLALHRLEPADFDAAGAGRTLRTDAAKPG